MINTVYPIDAVVTWDESFVPDGAQKFPLVPCFVDKFTKFVVEQETIFI